MGRVLADKELSILVKVPITSFRAPRAREYLETMSFPPPATVYGFLLSLIGEEDRKQYEGSKIGIGMLGLPEKSTVLRTVWRIKDKKNPPGTGNNKRPDYQEILSGINLVVWIKNHPENEQNNLFKKVKDAVIEKKEINRYSGLSFGESTFLVNEVNYLENDLREPINYLKPSNEGKLSLPIWVDHVGSKGTVFKQFLLETNEQFLPEYWIKIVSGKS